MPWTFLLDCLSTIWTFASELESHNFYFHSTFGLILEEHQTNYRLYPSAALPEFVFFHYSAFNLKIWGAWQNTRSSQELKWLPSTKLTNYSTKQVYMDCNTTNYGLLWISFWTTHFLFHSLELIINHCHKAEISLSMGVNLKRKLGLKGFLEIRCLNWCSGNWAVPLVESSALNLRYLY